MLEPAGFHHAGWRGLVGVGSWGWVVADTSWEEGGGGGRHFLGGGGGGGQTLPGLRVCSDCGVLGKSVSVMS